MLVMGVSLTQVALALEPGLTPDFEAWLEANGYGGYDLARLDVPGGSFGGREASNDPVTRDPVVFVHGNSDSALGAGPGLTGWTASIEHLISQGYRSSELYATTWGPADPALSAYQYHSRAHLTRIRAFIEAVLEYTGAEKVDVISHSMGVTLARKAIKGGYAHDAAAGGDYDLGPSLSARVDTFVGIAGANRGLASCYYSGPTTPTCGSTNGFYPGYMVGLLGPFGVSDFLVELNTGSHFEGDHVYSMWSTVDEVIGYGCVVWGRYTPQIPGQDGEVRFGSYPYGHINVKDLTGSEQLRMIRDHATW
jgi:hypothetical protein